MKRITSILAFLIIVFASFSAVAEPAFIGAWAALREPADSASEISVLRVFPDHKAYFSHQYFTEESIGEDEKGVYTWEQEEDFAFHLIDEAGEEIGRYCLLNEDRLMTKNDMFVRIDFYVREYQAPEPTAVPLNNLETGFLLAGPAAATNMSDYCGSWFSAREMKNNYYCYLILHLFADGTGYYISNILENGEVPDDQSEIAITWETYDDGIRVWLNGGYIKYHLIGRDTLKDEPAFSPSFSLQRVQVMRIE